MLAHRAALYAFHHWTGPARHQQDVGSDVQVVSVCGSAVGTFVSPGIQGTEPAVFDSRRSIFYSSGKGLPVAAISAVDLALWDLLGKIRNEPVYKMIGGQTKTHIPFYMTGPSPPNAKRMGCVDGSLARSRYTRPPVLLTLFIAAPSFWGAKVPLPYGPAEGHTGLRKNVEFLRAHRESVGPDYPIMVDCWMSLTVSYAIELAKKCLDEGIDINWWEECLHPSDMDGHRKVS